jgi:phage shock protein A
MPETINVAGAELRPFTPRPPRPERPARPAFAFSGMVPTAIFSRTRDIVAANFTDLLDKAEDPAKMIRMIIMEMEETLVEVRASAARSIADQKEMRRQVAKLERLQDSWTEKAELALSKDREDLAKAALVEKQKAGRIAEEIEEEIGRLNHQLRACELDRSKLEARLRDARTRQAAIAARVESARNRERLRQMHSGPKVDAVFARFELLERHADLAEGRADATMLGSRSNEIEQLCSEEIVAAELEALKTRLSHAIQ